MGAQHEGHGGHAHGGHAGAHGTLGGLSVSAGGYILRAMPTVFEAGREETFGVRILDRMGREVRNLDEQHEKLMHLIVVRRDLTHYQHLHPSLDEDGSWSVPLTLPVPGVYRAFVDFSVNGEPLTLGVDLVAPARRSSSTPSSRVRGATGCFYSSLTPAWSARRPLPWRSDR